MSANPLPPLQVANPVILPVSSSSVPAIPQAYLHPGLSLSQIFAMLWAHRKLTMVIVATIVILTGTVSKLLPKTYQANATLMVNYEVNDPLGGREFPIGLLGSYMATQIELMQSPEVLLPVVERLKLTENKEYTAGYRGDGSTLSEWVQRAVAKKLLVEQGRAGSQLIYVNFSASNPQEAANVANMVAEVYSEQVSLRLTGPATDRAKRYTEQLEELKSKVNHAQDQVTEFRQRTGLVAADAKVDVDLGLLQTLEQRHLEAQNLSRAAEARTTADQSVGSQVLASSLVQTLKTQLSNQEAKMAELRATLGPRHPQVLELQSQMDATRRSLGTEVHNYSSNANSELVSARELEKKMQIAVDEQRAKVLAARKLQDEGAKYQLELESAQSVYKRALDGYDQIMFASSGHYTNVSFVSRATPPLKASKPKTIVNVLLAFVVGGFIGIAGPLVYELFNRRVRCRDDLERDFGIPVLVELDAITDGRGYT